MIAATVALCLAGCNGGYIVQAGWGAPIPVPAPAPSATASVASAGSGGVFGTLFATGILAAMFNSSLSFGPPDLDPSRRVSLQDCSRPIEDPSANLRCR